MKNIISFIFILWALAVVQAQAQDLDRTKAIELVKANASLIGIALDADLPFISNAYTDQAKGLTYIYAQQSYRNIKVYNVIKTLVFKQNVLQFHSGKFINHIADKVGLSIPSISAKEAINKTIQHLGLLNTEEPEELKNDFADPQKRLFNAGKVAKQNIMAELFWFSNDEGKTIHLVWNISIDVINSSDYWMVSVDALTGNILGKINYTLYEAKEMHTEGFQHQLPIINKNIVNNKWPINKEKKNQAATSTASYNVVPYPYDNRFVGNIASEKDPWIKAGVNNKATSYGWQFDGTYNYLFLCGNNIYAYDDSLNINAPGRSPTSTTANPSLSFNFTPDFTQQPTTIDNRSFATTNLFYWNNIMHDVFYQYGFNEAAANFQSDNMGRGGVGADFIVAEAQDGKGTNNANFSTPPDGGNGRMQMYLYKPVTGTIKFDGDLDNGVITHEYGHGISNRLTGGGTNVGCLQNLEQAGEGWSDYIGLMMTTDWNKAKTTDGTKICTHGQYASSQVAGGLGNRTYPYTTNMTVDPHSYSDVARNGEVHYIGEVWCSVLWDMTWYIIQQEGLINPNLYDANGNGGNVIALNLVIQGMKLQPCSPGFLDARDAIFAADSILYGSAHKCSIWKAFARRGMGLSAVQGSSNSTSDQTVAFDTPCFNATGRVSSPLNLPITGVKVYVKNNDFDSTYTDSIGNYSFTINSQEQDTIYAISRSNINDKIAVSSIDVALIQAHILQKNVFNNNYKIIAADVNRDGKISALDIVYIKRFILGIDSAFPGNKIWVFVDSGIAPSDVSNPFSYSATWTSYKKTYHQSNLSFIGIKLGDVDWDWRPKQLIQQPPLYIRKEENELMTESIPK